VAGASWLQGILHARHQVLLRVGSPATFLKSERVGGRYFGLVDLGPPISYTVLSKGTPVLSRDGQKVGEIEHVLAAEDADIFDGLVVDVSPLPAGLRFVDASQVESLHERGVVLTLDASEVEGLPEPSENPATLRPDPDDLVEGELEHKLRRAWDLISGRY
jgi:hypothetical protein